MADGFDRHHAIGVEASRLCDLDFTEILFTSDFQSVQLRRPESGRDGLSGCPDNLLDEVRDLGEDIRHAFQRHESSEADNAEGTQIAEGRHRRIVSRDRLRLKVTRVSTIGGGMLYHCRRLRQPIPGFPSIDGMSEPVRKHMISLGRNKESGLLIFSGLPGSGKTTTMLSFLVHMTKVWGDVAALIEREPEYRLNGIIAQTRGRIVQLDGADEGSCSPAACAARLRRVLTLGPRFAAVGDASSGADARLAADLAMAGVLTFVTVDATDIVAAVSNTVNRAAETMGMEAARDAMALSLRGCVHQALSDACDARDRTIRKLKVQTVFLSGQSGGPGVVSKIKNDQIGVLAQEAARQEQRVAAGGALFDASGR